MTDLQSPGNGMEPSKRYRYANFVRRVVIGEFAHYEPRRVLQVLTPVQTGVDVWVDVDEVFLMESDTGDHQPISELAFNRLLGRRVHD